MEDARVEDEDAGEQQQHAAGEGQQPGKGAREGMLEKKFINVFLCIQNEKPISKTCLQTASKDLDVISIPRENYFSLPAKE